MTKLSDSRRAIDPERRARLIAELKTPYRPLRQFVYVACGASGFFGGLIILGQLLAGNNVETALPNLAVQAGVIGLVIVLWRWDRKKR